MCLQGRIQDECKGGGVSKTKAVSNRYWAAPSMRRHVATPPQEGGLEVPPLQENKYLVASGSIENDFNAQINNPLHKLDIVILNVIENNIA